MLNLNVLHIYKPKHLNYSLHSLKRALPPKQNDGSCHKDKVTGNVPVVTSKRSDLINHEDGMLFHINTVSICLFYCYFDAEDWAQSFTYAKQELCPWATAFECSYVVSMDVDLSGQGAFQKDLCPLLAYRLTFHYHASTPKSESEACSKSGKTGSLLKMDKKLRQIWTFNETALLFLQHKASLDWHMVTHFSF